MKFLIVLAVCVAAAAAASVSTDEKTAETLKQVMENHEDGSYLYKQETSNGIFLEETGSLKTVPNVEEKIATKEGSYSYSGPDGKTYTVHYVADESGYHPTGDHLPK